MSASTRVSVHELKPRTDEAVVIDVRTPGEFESIHLPGSRNVPLDELDEHVDQIRATAERGDEVVLVCQSGARAEQAQERLAEAGVGPLPVLDGGVAAWEQADGDVVRDVIRWSLERQVRLVAGSVVLLAVLASIVWEPAKFIAAFIGAGLTFAAVTNTCGMALALSKLPYNQPRTSRSADPVGADA